MRVIEISNRQIIVQMDKDEFDNCLNNALDDQYRIGYETGYCDRARIHDANMDDDNPKEE